MSQLVDLSQGCQVLASPKSKPFVFVKPVDANQVFVSFYAGKPDPSQIASEAWPNAGGIQFTVVPGDYSSCDIPPEAMDGAQLNPKVVKFPSSDFVCPVPGTVITDSDGVSYITIVPILAKSLCETACISENALAAGDMVLSCVDGKLMLKAMPEDKTVTYDWSEVNPDDGDGIIAWEVVGTEQPSGTVVSTQIITLPEETDGVHFSGQPTLVDGVITFPTVNDHDESSADPVLFDTQDIVDDLCSMIPEREADEDTRLDVFCDKDGIGKSAKKPPCVCSATVAQTSLLGSDYNMGEASGATWEAFIASLECKLGCSVSTNVIPTPRVNPFGISAGYHNTMIKTASGVATSGNSMAADGSNQLTMTEINQANGYDYSGSILLFKAGGFSYASILTTEGLWVWGRNVPWEQRQLPDGVSPADVKEYHIAESTFMTLTTKAGDVYTTSDLVLGVRADSWTKQPIAAVKFALPIIETFVESTSTSYEITSVTMFAVTISGDFYTWGIGPSTNELLGDGNVASAQAAPVLMVNPLPANTKAIKLGGIQRSGRDSFRRDGLNYMILGSNGKVYALGDGAFGANGNGSEADTLAWAEVQDEFDILANVADIQTSHHVHGAPSAMSISTAGIVKSWGGNGHSNIGVTGAFASVATVPLGVVGKTYAGAIGGHISPIINAESAYYGNVGHNAEGAFGDGTLEDRTSYEYQSLGDNAPGVDIVRVSISCPAGECPSDIAYTNTLSESKSIGMVCC